MIISKVTPAISCAHKIIDAHGHTGNFGENGRTYTCIWNHLLDKNLPNGDYIDKVIVSNLNGIVNRSTLSEFDANVEMLKHCKTYPDRFIPLAVCRPEREKISEIETLFKKYKGKFFGLKFHPNESRLNATSEKYIPYLKFAEKHKLPCVFHCQANEWSNAQSIYTIAKNIPKTPVILAHLTAGTTQSQLETIDLIVNAIKENKTNLYTDISWVDVDNKSGAPTIINLIKKLINIDGKDYTNRILFGTDAPIARFAPATSNPKMAQNAYNGFVEKIKNAIKADIELSTKSDELIDKIFYKNAEELFLKSKNKITSIAKRNKTIKCIGITLAIGATAILGVMGYNKYSKNTNTNTSHTGNYANFQTLNQRNL